jgi:cholesterol transport system auxiliary component
MIKGHRFHLDRRALLAGAASLIVAGCSDLIGPPAAPTIYVLKPRGTAPKSGKTAHFALSIDVPDATNSFDTTRIAISRSPNTLDFYADAAWPDRLPIVVQSVMVDAFEDSSHFDQVTRAGAGVHATYILQTEIEDFEARYDQPDGAPTAVVQIAAKLVEERTRSIVGHRTFTQEQPASANSVPAAVDALNASLGSLFEQMIDWALDAAPLR